MSNKNLLTIFILTYERPELLKECLENLNNQTFKDFKVIILDNTQYIGRYDFLNANYTYKIKYIKNKKNLGAEGNGTLAYSWNIDTEYFMIFHDDDLMHENYLDYSINFLLKNNNVSWIGSNYSLNINLFNKALNNQINTFDKSKLISEIFKGLNYSLSSIIYKKSNTLNINFNDYYQKYSILCDRPYIIDLIPDDKLIAIIKEPMIFYRNHLKQESKTSKSRITVEDQISFFLYYKKNNKKNFFNYIKFQIFIAYNLTSSFKRLNNIKQISTLQFLAISKKNGLIDYLFPLFYLTARSYIVYKNFVRIFKNKG